MKKQTHEKTQRQRKKIIFACAFYRSVVCFFFVQCIFAIAASVRLKAEVWWVFVLCRLHFGLLLLLFVFATPLCVLHYVPHFSIIVDVLFFLSLDKMCECKCCLFVFFLLCFCSLQLVLVLYDYCYWYSFSLAMHHLKAMSEHSSRKGKRFRRNAYTFKHDHIACISFFLPSFVFITSFAKAAILMIQRANDDGNREKSHTQLNTRWTAIKIAFKVLTVRCAFSM